MSNKLPHTLVKTLKENYHIEEEPFFELHEAGETVTSVRLNPFKRAEFFAGTESIPWTEYGRYLSERPSIHCRSVVSRRLLLRTGGIFHVFGTYLETNSGFKR